MLFYFFIIVISTFLAFVCRHSVERDQPLLLAILTVFIASFAGLRGVGTDFFNYADRFNSSALIDKNDFSLIYIFMDLCKRLGFGYQFFIYVVSIITTVIVVYVFWKYRYMISFPFAIFSYMLQFYQMSFNIFRQILAAAFFLLAVTKFGEKKYKQTIVFYIIGCLVHSSVVPFGLFFLVRKYLYEDKYLKKRMAVYAVVAILVYNMPLYVQAMLNSLLSRFPHYGAYFANFQYQHIGLGFFRYILLAIIPTVFITLSIRQDNELREKYSNIQFCSFFSIIGTELWMLSYVSTAVIYRSGYTLLLALPILHGFFVKNVLPKYRIFVIVAFSVVLIYFWFYDYGILNSGETVPYVFGFLKQNY